VIRKRFSHLSVEEFANTITHGFGLLLSVIGFAVLIVLAALRGDPWLAASCLVYGTSLVVLYAASTCYHGAVSPRLKSALRIVDHCCIYLLIAGTYTPFLVMGVGGQTGRTLLAAVWLLAFAGILFKIIFRERLPVLSVTSYVVMGWLGVFALGPMMDRAGAVAAGLAIAGGIAYTIGVVFFAWRTLPHNHAIFHVFVLGGSIIHYVAVLLYVVA
jgi:hemolysin III